MQISVVVANIHVRTMKTEVEQVSRGTSLGPGLVGPEGSAKALHWRVAPSPDRESG